MEDNLIKIRNLCKGLNIPSGKLSDEYLFTLNMVDLFYYNKNIGQVDIKTNWVDGSNDGGVDYIYSDDETMYLIQGKSSSSLSVDEVKTALNKMDATVKCFENNQISNFSKQMQQTYLTCYEDLNENKNIELVLFTNTLFKKNQKNNLNNFIKSQNMKSYSVKIYDYDDITTKDLEVYQDSGLIDEDSIEIYLDSDKNNTLTYNNEQGMIVNIKASSLKKLYIKYSKKGLFSFNLREHIKQKNVDEKIEETINNDKDNFWFYNNGITIGCNDFYLDGNRIKLFGFSIINGAQTTTKIGEAKDIDEDYDFALVCKLVKSESASLEYESEFISKISRASNSQKPIKFRDLKSNAREQKQLQKLCATNKYPLAITIKRGVPPKNKKIVEKWQRIDNDNLGQLIYACLLQHPGKARNAKTILFSSEKVYTSVFLIKHDPDTLYDLVRLSYVYEQYKTDRISTMNENDFDRITIIKNGKLPVMAVCVYLLKKELGIVDNFLSSELCKNNITGLFITDSKYDDIDQRLYELFDFVIKQLYDYYNSNKTVKNITSVSNFFKSDTYYGEVLNVFDNLDNYDKKKVSEYMDVFLEKK